MALTKMAVRNAKARENGGNYSLSDGDGRHDWLPDSLRPAGCRGFGVLDDDVLDIDHVHCGEEQMFREKMGSCTSSLLPDGAR